MTVFVDTSAIVSSLVSSDRDHARALACWADIELQECRLYTTNYVLLECAAIGQSRFGLSFVNDLEQRIVPLLNVIWIAERDHRAAQEAWLAAQRRNVSLVDFVSATMMRRVGILDCFTFDKHFAEMGFRVMPEAK